MEAKKYWIRRGSNSGPFPCEGNVIPLHHEPNTRTLHFKGLMISQAKSLKLSKGRLFFFSPFILKKLDPPGIEPGAFRLQSERDTTTPRTLNKKGENY